MPLYVDIPTSHYKTTVLQYLEEGVQGDFSHGCVLFINSYNYLTYVWILSTIVEGSKSDIFRPLFWRICQAAWVRIAWSVIFFFVGQGEFHRGVHLSQHLQHRLLNELHVLRGAVIVLTRSAAKKFPLSFSSASKHASSPCQNLSIYKFSQLQ